ncbi:tumor necrosis factor receptor superfamily member 9a [Xyrichtys novacula]|uniref:Tumor necrosis factor receptor superfamily member 9a n=1 Tax=Xyrichtys novacula TaxID=13765 RepID=A0AAV1HFM3_XYRNO|nr:tumor necrosis factor receptor superfamily member 9a [Xyrichtys novacula]
MAVILWVLGLTLLVQSSVCSVGNVRKGCQKWSPNGDDVCCEICRPGNRLVRKCGPDPEKLCTPCEEDSFTNNPLSMRCDTCRRCLGSLVHVKDCTATSDTVCGCEKGLTCGNDPCTFCVKKCDRGQERADGSSCRPCPEGTFNNQTQQQKCQPWSTKCPHPGQQIIAKGNAFSDIKCAVIQIHETKQPENPRQAWLILLVALLVVFAVLVIFITTVACEIRKRKSVKVTTPEKTSEKMLIKCPSDEPRTLIAIECSFHEAQQEQGSSSESLVSKDSAEQLLP